MPDQQSAESRTIKCWDHEIRDADCAKCQSEDAAMTNHTSEDVRESEPDMSWFDIAITHGKEVVILGNSPGWDDFDIGHWWVDTFANEEPEGLAPGAYRWTGFQIGQWDEDEYLVVTGGTFAPIPPPAASTQTVAEEGEPVAWMYTKKSSLSNLITKVVLAKRDLDRVAYNWTETPLYTRPSPAHDKTAPVGEACTCGNDGTTMHDLSCPRVLDDYVPAPEAETVASPARNMVGSDEEVEAVKHAYMAGATAVHEYWLKNPGEAPQGDPEFGEAASDYAQSALAALRGERP